MEWLVPTAIFVQGELVLLLVLGRRRFVVRCASIPRAIPKTAVVAALPARAIDTVVAGRAFAHQACQIFVVVCARKPKQIPKTAEHAEMLVQPPMFVLQGHVVWCVLLGIPTAVFSAQTFPITAIIAELATTLVLLDRSVEVRLVRTVRHQASVLLESFVALVLVHLAPQTAILPRLSLRRVALPRNRWGLMLLVSFSREDSSLGLQPSAPARSLLSVKTTSLA